MSKRLGFKCQLDTCFNCEPELPHLGNGIQQPNTRGYWEAKSWLPLGNDLACWVAQSKCSVKKSYVYCEASNQNIIILNRKRAHLLPRWAPRVQPIHWEHSLMLLSFLPLLEELCSPGDTNTQASPSAHHGWSQQWEGWEKSVLQGSTRWFKPSAKRGSVEAGVQMTGHRASSIKLYGALKCIIQSIAFPKTGLHM